MSSIIINIGLQQLVHHYHGRCEYYRVSTSKYGAGQQQGSNKTPLGKHIIRAKIGQGAPLNSVFVARRATGEIFRPQMLAGLPGRDWILTRILWLSGLEPGLNRLGDCDTMRRLIYIHGTPYEHDLGEPVSLGCVRMANRDIGELFERVDVGAAVNIIR